MVSERLKIVQALDKLDVAVSIDKIAVEAGLSRGKVLGNLSRLCVNRLVDKRGKLYAVTERGRVILKEAESVPYDKAFYFCFGEDKPTGHMARSLREFYDIARTIDSESLLFHLRRGDFEKWIKNVFGDRESATEIANLRLSEVSGDDLRNKFCESIGQNYKILTTLTT